VTAADVATLATAAFAAVAAGASWASVLQTRRERLAARTPDLHLEVMEAIGPTGSVIQIQIINSGGLAKLVRFGVVQGREFAFGHPPPSPTFRSGESRILETALTPVTPKTVAAYVACFDAERERFYFWPHGGRRQVFRVADLERDFTNDSLMRQLQPDFDIQRAKMVLYKTIERSL
jgi:hypothetical protein